MGITTKLVQSVLYIEMTLFTMLLLPIPKYFKKSFIDIIYNSRLLQPFIHILYVLYTMILIMFIDSLVKLNRNIPYDLIYHTERNFYLTGFTLYLSLVFKIFVSMLNTLYKEEESVNILKKQIKNSQTFVDSIINKTSDKDELIIKYQNQIKELNKKILSDEILIKQYTNNQNEYYALLDKYNEIINKKNRENKKSK